MLALRRVSQFKKDYKRCLKRGYDIEKLHTIIELLAKGKKLDVKCRDHSLLGEYREIAGSATLSRTGFSSTN